MEKRYIGRFDMFNFVFGQIFIGQIIYILINLISVFFN